MDLESTFIAVGICLMTLWGVTIVTDLCKSVDSEKNTDDLDNNDIADEDLDDITRDAHEEDSRDEDTSDVNAGLDDELENSEEDVRISSQM